MTEKIYLMGDVTKVKEARKKLSELGFIIISDWDLDGTIRGGSDYTLKIMSQLLAADWLISFDGLDDSILGYFLGLRAHKEYNTKVVTIIGDCNSAFARLPFVNKYKTEKEFYKGFDEMSKDTAGSDDILKEFVKYAAAALFYTAPKEEDPLGNCAMTVVKKEVENFIKQYKYEVVFDEMGNMEITYKIRTPRGKEVKENKLSFGD